MADVDQIWREIGKLTAAEESAREDRREIKEAMRRIEDNLDRVVGTLERHDLPALRATVEKLEGLRVRGIATVTGIGLAGGLGGAGILHSIAKAFGIKLGG